MLSLQSMISTPPHPPTHTSVSRPQLWLSRGVSKWLTRFYHIDVLDRANTNVSWCINIKHLRLFQSSSSTLEIAADKTTSPSSWLKAPEQQQNGPGDCPFACLFVHLWCLPWLKRNPWSASVKSDIPARKLKGVYRSPLLPRCACKAMVVFDLLL